MSAKTDIDHLIGLCETAILNANKAENGTNENTQKVNANETNISNSSWDSTKFYSAEDYVMHNNILKVCLMDNIGIEPSNTLYWKSANIAEELNKLKSLIKKEEK